MAFDREEWERRSREEIDNEEDMRTDKRRFYDTGNFWVMLIVIILTVPTILYGISYLLWALD